MLRLLAEFNNEKMIDVLDKLQDNYCPSCDVGAAGREVGYLSPGSCIDYAYDELKVLIEFNNNENIDKILICFRDLSLKC